MSIDNNKEPGPFSSNADKVRRTEPIVGEVQDAQYRCHICGQVFTNKTDLEEHVKSHQRVQEKVEKEVPPAGVS
jgi:transposase-like protein